MKTITKNKEQLRPELWSVRYKSYLAAIASKKLPADIVEDILQETYLAALRSAPGFRGDSTERSWLTSILHHKIMDHYRKAYSRQGKVMHEALRVSEYPRWHEWENPANKPDNAEITEFQNADDLVKVINSGFELLGQREEQVLRLKIKGYSTEAICDRLEINEVNTWVALSRARKKIKHYLNDHWLN